MDSKPDIIGRVKTISITCVEKEVRAGELQPVRSVLMKGKVYNVIGISNSNGHTFYVTDQWYKEHRGERLIIADTMVDYYRERRKGGKD